MSMNNNSNQQNLCKQGCGFYGNAQNMDMCSKCYENFLKTSSNQEAPHSQSSNQLSPFGSSQDKSNKTIHKSQNRKRQLAQSILLESGGVYKVPKMCKKDDSVQYAAEANQIVELFTNDETSRPISVVENDEELDSSPSNSEHNSSHNSKKPRRCEFCRRKVGLTGFDCRCGGHYCAVHRYSDKHSCTFDYQAHGQEQIKHQNPMICGTKIKKI